MKITLLIAAALFGASLARADASLVVRELGRVVVTHCYMQNPAPPVVIVEHPEVFVPGQSGGVATETEVLRADIEVDGEPVTPDVGCRVLDSHVHSVDFTGSMMVWNNGGAMSQIMYTVSVTDGVNVYRFADWASALDWSPNGARYTVGSNLLLDEDGAGLEYDITFLRRAPAEHAAQVPGFGEAILPVYDPVTIFRMDRVTPDGFISVIADYREQ